MPTNISTASWTGGHTLIAHALGRIGGNDYTNSRQALVRSYERGFRLFEVDVSLTSDGIPVLVHGWRTNDYTALGWEAPADDDEVPMSASAFRGAKIHGKYSTLQLTDLRAYMVDHPETRVLFDIRPQSPEATRLIYSKISSIIDEPKLRRRCMAGTYNTEMAAVVRDLNEFEFINLYYDNSLYATVEEFVGVCRDLKVNTATVNREAEAQLLKPLSNVGVEILRFTINKPNDVVSALDRGVAAVGTDAISPEQVKRAGQTVLRELVAYEDARGNVVSYTGTRPPANVTIRIRGCNNKLVVSDHARLDRLDVLFDNNNAQVTIGSSRAGIPTLELRIRAGQDAKVTVGNDVTTTRSVFLSATEGTSVTVGDDVMFATNNEVRADDAHAIFDVATGKRVNPSESIVIGAHVWLARDVVVLGGVKIGEGTVVGYRSLVTRSLPNNCMAVGSPAKPVRRNIAWERAHLDDYPPYKPDASVIEKSRFWNMTTEASDPVIVAARTESIWDKIKRRVRKMVRRS